MILSPERARQRKSSPVCANPTFEALFAAERSTFDMHEQLQAGKLIVINASAGNETYARFWIEEVAACIAPRFKIPHEQRTPTTFIIDEAQTWIAEDLHFAAILDKAAEARIGMLIAAHHMGQIKDPQVRGSIYTNTTLKFTAETHEDINALSRSMGNCKTDFLSKIPLYQFAYYGPNMPEAIKVEFPLVAFKTWQKMSREEYAMIRDDNRRAYAYDPAQPEPTSRTERLANTFDVHVYAFINNVPVRMVVDTGATSVVLSVADAKRVGVDITKVQFTGTSTTVGGTVRHADIVLPSMRVDSIELLAVHALVVDTNESLLGQTFLSRLESYHMQGDILTMVGPRPQSPRDPSKPSKEGW